MMALSPASMASVMSSKRFIWSGLLITLCLVWIVNRSSLGSARDAVATMASGILSNTNLGSNSSISSSNANDGSVSAVAQDRPLVLFAYAESDTARKDLEFFVRNGIHRRADFIFIFNGETNATEMIPKDLPNVRVVQRDNSCFDLGAFGEVLKKDDLWKNYKRFITLNASVRGPFLPVHSDACWTDVFLNRVTETNKLVGLTYNCVPRPHIQSMLYATDDIGMKILLDPELAHSIHHYDKYGTRKDAVGLSECYADYHKAIHAEVGTTELVMSQGYTVDVMMASYHGQEEGKKYCDVVRTKDHLRQNMYFGSNIHPYETVFIKANRDIDPNLIEHMTQWHMKMNHTAWEVCGP